MHKKDPLLLIRDGIFSLKNIFNPDIAGTRYCSVVERSLMVQWVIFRGGPIKLFLIPASAPLLV